MHTTFCLPIHLSVGTCIYLLAAVKNAAMNMGVQIWKLTFASFVMACAKLLQPCNRMYRSPPGSSDNGISQARILEWVATPSPGELPHPGSKPEYLALTGIFSTTEPPVDSPKNCADVHAKSLQSCRTLCNTMDCTLLGSSVRGILQARILEWVVMPFSRGSS